MAAVGSICFAACGNQQQREQSVREEVPLMPDSLLPDPAAFADTIDGKPVALYLLKNGSGIAAAITNFGARIVGVLVPDVQGKPTDVVMGFGSIKEYMSPSERFFGPVVGRVGNRIAKGRFSVDGKSYTVPVNNGPNTLHGGKKGLDGVVWDAEQTNDSTLVLSYLSPDGEEGFPGNLQIKVTYALGDDRSLQISYEATTDQKTPVNLTNHAFFNLNGEGGGTINNHLMQIFADRYTPVDKTLIPLGTLDPVEGTPFDFRALTPIGQRVDEDHEQLKFGQGYDHNFVLNKDGEKRYTHAAKVIGDLSGIIMDIYTEEPGLQFYGGNFMRGDNTFKSGAKDEFRTGMCLETQHFPDAVNQPSFPSILLEPGATYQTRSAYVFSVR